MADDKTKRGATAVMPYSVRARPGAPGAAPITWAEMDTIDTPSHYHIGDERVAETISYKGSQRLGQGGPGPADQVLPDL
jgi:bifunctional non-homologous end joining protein LigD